MAAADKKISIIRNDIQQTMASLQDLLLALLDQTFRGES
jgi:hypothetical protein